MSKARDLAEQVVAGYCYQRRNRLGPEDALAWLQNAIEKAMSEYVGDALKQAAMKAAAREFSLREDRKLLEWLAAPGSWRSRFDDAIALLAQRPDAGFIAAARRAMQIEETRRPAA